MHALFDIFVFGVRGVDLDDHRLARHAARHLADGAVERCRKQHGLPAGRRRQDNFLDIFDEAHVEHTISFVEHKNLQLRKVDFSRFHVIDQTTGRGDENFRIARQQFHLLRIRHATQNRHRLEPAQAAGVLVSGSGDLQCQFAGRCQYQHFRLGSTEARAIEAARTRRLPILVGGALRC